MTKKNTHSFLADHSSIIGPIAIAILVASMFFAVERLELLPLQGQATPMYGALSVPRVRKPMVRKPSNTSARRAVREMRNSVR